jgi:hypothetical protein
MLTLTWKGKRPRITNTVLKKKKAGEQTLSDFKTYYKTTAVKAVWHSLKNTYQGDK